MLLTSTCLLSSERYDEIKFDGLTQISQSVTKETLNFKNKNSYELEEINKSIKRFFEFGYFTNIWTTNENDIVLDFFAGSGTTAEAVIKVNSLTNSKRKFILVEQMDYIETVTSKRAINSFKSYGVSDNFVFF